jgi:hypothetical protein
MRNNKPGIINRDNEMGTCMLMYVAISGDRNVIKKVDEKFVKYTDPRKNAAHVGCKNKCNATNNRVNWNHLRVIQKIPERHTEKARNQGNGQCTHTSESTNVRVQNVKHVYGFDLMF